MSFLIGKKALITGLISDRSIAYGIAKAMHSQVQNWLLVIKMSALRIG